MYIEQLYTNCLAEAAYYIESDGKAAIIDPLREVDPYINLAESRKAKIEYVFETHFHADFVSGHLDLSRKTGARIVFGPGARAEYPIHEAKDGEEIKLGSVTIRVLHTPGHTLESSCYLLLDERNIPHSVFTGDTLFVGDVGRPDLAVNATWSREQLAGLMYDSIHAKLLTLPNYVVVYPGHGAGSACGKSLGAETFSTIGFQKLNNYALKARGRDEFIRLVTEGLSAPPKYFFMDASINKKGYDPIDEVIRNNFKALDVKEVTSLIAKPGTVVVDSRSGSEFATGFIPQSVNIGLDGAYAVVAGSILEPQNRIVLVTEPGREYESVLRLARVGFENVAGYLEGGIRSWQNAGKPLNTLETITADEFTKRFSYRNCTVVDIRNADEWVPGFVAGAKLIPLPELENRLAEIDRSKPCYVYCAAGYRSVVGSSLLKKHGFEHVVNVTGGFTKIRKTSISIQQFSAIS